MTAYSAQQSCDDADPVDPAAVDVVSEGASVVDLDLIRKDNQVSNRTSSLSKRVT